MDPLILLVDVNRGMTPMVTAPDGNTFGAIEDESLELTLMHVLSYEETKHTA